MTQEDLARSMQGIGIAWQRVVVAKLESGRRSYLTVEELLGLCIVLEISPVDLLVPKDLNADTPYRIVPNATARAVDAREFVRGEGILPIAPYPEPVREPAGDGKQIFASPVGFTFVDPIQWMPPDRAERVADRYEYDPEDEEQDR